MNMQITIDETLQDFLEEQAAKKGFATPVAYVEALLADLQQRTLEKKELEAMLLEGVRSPHVIADEAFWAERRRKILERDPQFKP